MSNLGYDKNLYVYPSMAPVSACCMQLDDPSMTTPNWFTQGCTGATDTITAQSPGKKTYSYTSPVGFVTLYPWSVITDMSTLFKNPSSCHSYTYHITTSNTYDANNYNDPFGSDASDYRYVAMGRDKKHLLSNEAINYRTSIGNRQNGGNVEVFDFYICAISG